MNIQPDVIITIDKNLNSKEILNNISNTIVSFAKSNQNFIIDYKVYLLLKKLSIETQNLTTLPQNIMAFKIETKDIKVKFLFSMLDSDYLLLERFFKISGNPKIYSKAENFKSNILIKMSD